MGRGRDALGSAASRSRCCRSCSTSSCLGPPAARVGRLLRRRRGRLRPTRPDPLPNVFGYHEIFHALVIVAVAVQYVGVAFWVVH